MATASKTGRSTRRKPASSRETGSHRIFDDVLALAGTLARGRKDYGADKLRSLAESTRAFSASMTDLPNLRVQAACAADSLEGLAEYVLHTDIEQMVVDGGTFARRHPVAALAAAVAVGLAATRLLMPQKASAKTGPARRAGSKRSASPAARKRTAPVKNGTNGRAHAGA
jgi:hypothetical protein